MKNRLFNLRQKKDFRVFCFTTFNALVALLLFELALPQYAGLAVFLIPELNMLSKRINNKYFGDIGVVAIPGVSENAIPGALETPIPGDSLTEPTNV